MRAIDADALEKILEKIPAADIKNMGGQAYVLVKLSQVFNVINNQPTIEPEPHWIPCSERLPEEDHWLGGSGRQFSDEVLVSVANYDDEDIWTYISQTIDGEWALELPRHCKIIAWMPLPEPYAERRTDEQDS